MKLVEAEYSFEGNKVLFFFTSDGRVEMCIRDSLQSAFPREKEKAL